MCSGAPALVPTQSAGEMLQTYWNGQRQLHLDQLPYATARDAAGHASGADGARHASPNRGQAQLVNAWDS